MGKKKKSAPFQTTYCRYVTREKRRSASILPELASPKKCGTGVRMRAARMHRIVACLPTMCTRYPKYKYRCTKIFGFVSPHIDAMQNPCCSVTGTAVCCPPKHPLYSLSPSCPISRTARDPKTKKEKKEADPGVPLGGLGPKTTNPFAGKGTNLHTLTLSHVGQIIT